MLRLLRIPPPLITPAEAVFTRITKLLWQSTVIVIAQQLILS